MPQTIKGYPPRALDLITELATGSREAVFPREAGGDRRQALAEVTYTIPYSNRCFEIALVEPGRVGCKSF